jgi:Xaa-Pro aminopeptidase
MTSVRPAEAPVAAPTAVPAPAAHDSGTPAALLDFMLTGWAPRAEVGWEPVAHLDAMRARRAALSARFPGDALVVPTGHEKVRANDTHYRFRPSSDFFWLTGCHEPDCVLVLVPAASGEGHRTLLFVEPANRDSAVFFTDRNKGELWVGPRLGVEGSRVRFGVDECRPLGELDTFLGGLAASGTDGVPRRVLRGLSPKVDSALPAAPVPAAPAPTAVADGAAPAALSADAELAAYLSEARLVKDAAELVELRAVIDATHRGFEDVIRGLRTAPSERWVEGIFGLRARVEGNDVGYGTIAACGSHACVLHWTRNDGPVRAGELLLLDAGVEGTSLYTADITRTLPISGRFTTPQRRIYELVWNAQQAALAAIRPGVDFMEPNRIAMRVLAEGLHALGILTIDPEEALRDDRQLYKRYSLHNISHMLGIDVHDCAKARQETYKFGKLVPGMVLTVEPGLYFQPDDLTVPAEYRGIGVRIEDDIVVTATGHDNLAANIPSAADDVEAWMARVWAAGS